MGSLGCAADAQPKNAQEVAEIIIMFTSYATTRLTESHEYKFFCINASTRMSLTYLTSPSNFVILIKIVTLLSSDIRIFS